MDMLRTYFEKSDKETSVYFWDKKIWACGQKYRDYQGKYPVIFLTFKDVKFDTWEETFAAIRDIFAKETRRHKELLASDKCDEYSKKTYAKLADGKVSEVELASALLDLSAMLHKHYAVAPIIIIDEYDTPIQRGYQKDYYNKVIRFMRNLFFGGFKDNQHLFFGFLTGILRGGQGEHLQRDEQPVHQLRAGQQIQRLLRLHRRRGQGDGGILRRCR